MSWVSHPEVIACCPWPRHCACLPRRGAVDLTKSGEGWEHILKQLQRERAGFETQSLRVSQYWDRRSSS